MSGQKRTHTVGASDYVERGGGLVDDPLVGGELRVGGLELSELVGVALLRLALQLQLTVCG